MVAAGIAVHPRRATEFTHCDNECLLVKTAVDKVGDEGINRPVKRRDKQPGPFFGFVLAGRAVVIPWDAVDGDKADAVLNQAAGQESTLAKRVAAVVLAKGSRLGRDIESLAGLRTGEQVERGLLVAIQITHRVFIGRSDAVQISHQLTAIGDPLEWQVTRKCQISDAKIRLVRIGIDDERIPASAELRCVVEVLVGTTPEVRYGDVGRHSRMILAADAGDNRAQSGPALLEVIGSIERWAFIGREHPVVAFGMVAGTVVDGSQNSKLVHDLGLLRHQLAKLYTRDTGTDGAKGATVFLGSLGLWIPSFHMARAAAEPKQDYACVFRSSVEGLCRSQLQQLGK